MRPSLLTLLLFAAVPATSLPLTSTNAAEVKRKPDLADRAAGTYEGSVVADTRGGSQSGVEITVKRVSKNLVEVSSDYPRVPTVQIPLTMASTAILAARSPHNFLIETDKNAKRLDLSIDGVTLIVYKQ